MKCFAIINPGLESLCQQELKELIGVESKIEDEVIEFLASSDQLLLLLNRMQSVRRLLVDLNEFETFPGKRFKVEVENVKGQENRVAISKKISEPLFEKNKDLEIDFKNPEVLVVAYITSKKEFVGVDLAGYELNKREFRLFAHSASFTGDFAYFIARQVDGETLFGFCKDGTIAIESALFLNKKVVLREDFSCLKFEMFKGVEFNNKDVGSRKLFAFDEVTQNVTAARKNSKLAGVELEVNKRDLDELDVRYEKDQFDSVVLHLTKKDEEKINEIYYQVNYVLKSKGELLLVTRDQFELSVSDKFKLVNSKELSKGQSVHKLWMLEKK